MGQRKNSKKSTTATVDSSTRQSKPAIAPLRPAGAPAPATPAAAKPTSERSAGPTHEQIAQKAHELWVRNGSKHGEDQKHWLEAEALLKKEMGVK
jgi:hypothetical protein